MIVHRLLAAMVLASIVPFLPARADDHGTEFFEKKIRPLLVQHCYQCHSADAKKVGGGLRLDFRAGILEGGDSGPAIEPGKPGESLLIKAIHYDDESVKMPPKKKLSAAAIADLEQWIRIGAPDPRAAAPAKKTANAWEESLRARRVWWSLQPVRRPSVPSGIAVDRIQHPVDRFIVAKLNEKGLSQAPAADPRTLIRRLYLVLTGLPPQPADVDAFLRRCEELERAGGTRQSAVERLVDSLLESPYFGERWARHWMDLVRFTETHGNEWNYEVHHAWRYRDYLIRAFNGDVPFDQFVREHIAGDLLAAPRWNRKDKFNESVIGTAFYRFGEANHDDCIGLRQIGFDLADNQIDTLSKAFQATTIACARCHDHKMDAVSMRDYYGLLGILRSSRLVSHTIDSPEVNVDTIRRLSERKAKIRDEIAANWMTEALQVRAYLNAAIAVASKQRPAGAFAGSLDPKRLEQWIAVLSSTKPGPEDPFQPLRAWIERAGADPKKQAADWSTLVANLRQESESRDGFNSKNFRVYTDFASGQGAQWSRDGQGLRSIQSQCGDVTIAPAGDNAIADVLPAGIFTHAVSDKLNGALRSPILERGVKHISFQVMGRSSSAVRLVSNNCQLNYKNYRALISDELQWITFSPPEDPDQLRVYAELMTKFNNPKFPDQLSALGGDKADYKLPWEKAAADPRSHFGVTRVVIHDSPQPPKASLAHLRIVFENKPVQSVDDVVDRYARSIDRSLRAFAQSRCDEQDVTWIRTLLKHGLVSNHRKQTPLLDSLVEDFRKEEAKLSIPRVVPGLADIGPGFEHPVFIRGDCLRSSESTPRRYLEVLSSARDSFPASGSGRRELAERIASPNNPLTARVIVNRIWGHLFGSGIVRSVDDFGHVGEAPSHPELLDYLAIRFLENGWSIKRLIRSLVLTQTFQSSDRPSSKAGEIDPENRYLQHYQARRMEAEAIRDSILFASGRLDLTQFGPSVQPYRESLNADRRLFPGPLDGAGRRSIYIKNNLMEGPKFLGVFNFPGGKVAQGRRDVTNVPAQALALLNDPFVMQQADVWATRLIGQKEATVESRIEWMFQLALNRPPAAEEKERFRHAVARFAEAHGVDEPEVLKSRSVWKDVAHSMFNVTEFIYIP